MGLLHDAGLDQVYLRDIYGLNSLLVAMGQRGMPVDAAKRFEAAQALEQQRATALAQLQAAVPTSCWPFKRYKRQPKIEGPVEVGQVTKVVQYCTYCTAKAPNKKHKCWKAQPKSTNAVEELVVQWLVRQPFVPSPKGLLTYFKHKGYALPKKYDRATGERRATTDEPALLRLALTHQDPVCALVLKYRDYDKQLSTVGRPA